MTNNTIILDVMGSDQGPLDLVLAARDFAKTNQNFNLQLVGDKVQIEVILESEYDNIKIVSSDSVVHPNDHIMSFRDKPNASLYQSISLLAKSENAVLVSAGSSKHYFAAAIFLIGCLKNIKRPAFMVQLPKVILRDAYLLDAGANITLSDQDVVNLISGAHDHLHNVLQKDNLKISFLVANHLRQYFNFDINNVVNSLVASNFSKEQFDFLTPQELYNAKSDLIFTDGWIGNIFLKTNEGQGDLYLSFMKQYMQYLSKESNDSKASFLKHSFADVKEAFNYQNYPGGIIFGLNKLCYKLHGSTNYQNVFITLNKIKRILN